VRGELFWQGVEIVTLLTQNVAEDVYARVNGDSARIAFARDIENATTKILTL